MLPVDEASLVPHGHHARAHGAQQGLVLRVGLREPLGVVAVGEEHIVGGSQPQGAGQERQQDVVPDAVLEGHEVPDLAGDPQRLYLPGLVIEVVGVGAHR